MVKAQRGGDEDAEKWWEAANKEDGWPLDVSRRWKYLYRLNFSLHFTSMYLHICAFTCTSLHAQETSLILALLYFATSFKWIFRFITGSLWGSLQSLLRRTTKSFVCGISVERVIHWLIIALLYYQAIAHHNATHGYVMFIKEGNLEPLASCRNEERATEVWLLISL